MYTYTHMIHVDGLAARSRIAMSDVAFIIECLPVCLYIYIYIYIHICICLQIYTGYEIPCAISQLTIWITRFVPA